MANQKILVPDMGDFKDVEIIEVLVKEGQNIKKNESLITLESDKSSVEVPSTHEGVIEKINVKIGDKVNKGDLILNLKIGETSKKKDTDLKKSQIKKPVPIVEDAIKTKIIPPAVTSLSSGTNYKPKSQKVCKNLELMYQTYLVRKELGEYLRRM